ncbi:MAG TPA: PAS domain-containing sensor histidine kinase [Acidimicrobiales bacterium]|nr:PAS domain-containing sensor histidine kinase [Acidimicrobiales bacterium]
MTNRSTGKPNLLPLSAAADMLGLTPAAVEGLARAGYLATAQPEVGDVVDLDAVDGPFFPKGDLKAFLARNADNGSGNLLLTEPGTADAADLLAALDGECQTMAQRAFEIFATVFPDTGRWQEKERARFIGQAKSRFEAILAVASQGAEVDDALTGDLEEIGAAAAWASSPLPQLLVILRISRDLVVQTAVELADERGRHWSLPLALFLTRVLPAIDRLTDSLAQGYWAAVVGREAEQKARYEHVVEHSSDGVYEVDLDGRIQYANPSLAVILGRPLEELEDSLITDVITPLDGVAALQPLVGEVPDGKRLDLVVCRPDGVRRVLEVSPTVRYGDGELVGFQGVVRDVTATRDLEADKNEFLALMTYDLRQPLTTVLGLGATLETHGPAMDAERIRRVGTAIRLQAERMSRLADDLYDISRLEARSLLLSPRAVDLADVVRTALTALEGADDVVTAVPQGVCVLVDPRRLEQVVANMVENGLVHGSPPVEISTAAGTDGMVELSFTDHGPGVPAALVPSLFNRVRILARRDRDRSRGTGLGLSLVKGLVEAMGGRVWYEPGPGGGAEFRLSLPEAPDRR